MQRCIKMLLAACLLAGAWASNLTASTDAFTIQVLDGSGGLKTVRLPDGTASGKILPPTQPVDNRVVLDPASVPKYVTELGIPEPYIPQVGPLEH
jgi:hypothetical protein